MLFKNALTLQTFLYKKVSQFITIVVHSFYSVKVMLDGGAIDGVEKEKIVYFFEIGWGCGSCLNCPGRSAFSL